ncbi:sensor histidine kinase [Arachidicoccus sp.]|uniref:sensor histidine kinase n=1 Tax=Arachidicoccus sp. TaxID=1872624 RepID=UPI003D25B854
MELKFRIAKVWRIAAQILFWIVVFLAPLYLYQGRLMNLQFYKREFINDLFLLFLFYFNVNFLIPRFFIYKKWVKYFLLVFISLVAVGVQQIAVEKIFDPKHLPENNIAAVKATEEGKFSNPRPKMMERTSTWRGWTDGEVDDPEIWGLPQFLFFIILKKALTTSLLLLFLGSFVKLSIVWFNTEGENERLQKENLKTELKFLKSQVNAHFLFNSLNGLYVLAHMKSENTEGGILKLSQIMRYMTYDTNVDFVSLSTEVEYLQNYIDLQTLRLPEFLEIAFLVQGIKDNLKIEPMLLIPFIENTFKHGISYNEKCRIDIQITIKDDQLVLETENRIFPPKVIREFGGIGLVNVKERLRILYGQRHHLSVLNIGKSFKVKLQIQLNTI